MEPPQIPIDSNGNLTQKVEGSDTWTYEWNARNELTRVTKNSIEEARFAYDPLGRRVEKVVGGVTTTYTYNGTHILREVRGSTTLKYVHGPGADEPLATDDGTALSYFQADALGSIVKVTNGSGAVLLTRQYDVWGSPEVGTTEVGYAFTGREWDAEAALYYNRARYYDPRIGRFISEDPSGVQDGPNLYSYVHDDPVNFVDPTGLACLRMCVAYRIHHVPKRGKLKGGMIGHYCDMPTACTTVCGDCPQEPNVMNIKLWVYHPNQECPEICGFFYFKGSGINIPIAACIIQPLTLS